MSHLAGLGSGLGGFKLDESKALDVASALVLWQADVHHLAHLREVLDEPVDGCIFRQEFLLLIVI